MGLEVTHRAIATAERVGAIRAIGGPVAEAVAAMLALHVERPREDHGGRGAALHDPCAVAYLLRPALFELRAMRIDVVTEPGPELGRTVALPAAEGAAAGGPCARVATGLDVEGFFDLVVERLARLPAARAAPRRP